MGQVLQEVEKSPRLIQVAKIGQRSCFLCRYIVEDLEKNGKLTGYPKDWASSGLFPVEGKLIHVILELGEIPPEDYEDLEKLASAVADALRTSTRLN